MGANDELLAELEEAILEAQALVRQLTAAYNILSGCSANDETIGRMIHLNRSRRISELADEVRNA